MNLGNAYLYHVCLRHANLYCADLHDAFLCYADLSFANLTRANLIKANLSHSYLNNANLHSAYLSNAILENADVSDADMSNTIRMKCPSAGEFIGWKIAGNHLIKLAVPEDARRSSGTTNCCRCSKAEVLGIFSLKGNKSRLLQVESDTGRNFVYSVGQTNTVSDFDGNRWNENSTGIHFFMTQEEVSAYSKLL